MFTDIFPTIKPLIGVVRLLPLPGYKEYPGLDLIIQTALHDIKNLEKGGFDGALVDNHHHPHVLKATPEMVDAFVKIMKILVAESNIPLGVQVLIDDPEAALLITKHSGGSFIRTDFFVDKVQTEHGIIVPRAQAIVAYKKKIGANNILILADVQVKHAIMMDSKKSINTSVEQAITAGADGVIVTGSWTGVAPDIRKVSEAKKAASNIPVLIGSGLTVNNLGTLLDVADGALIGTSIRDGSRINYEKAKKITDKLQNHVKEVKRMKNDIEGTRLIDLEPFIDFQEMKIFWEEKGISDSHYVVSGHMNLTWYGQKEGIELICQFGPSLKPKKQLAVQGKESYGYFHPEKYVHAQNICQRVLAAGIPCPQITDAGYDPGLSRAWSIAEKAQGVNLDDHWDGLAQVDKIKLLTQFGVYLGKLHSIPNGETQQDPESWYKIWIDSVFQNLVTLHLYAPGEIAEMKDKIVSKFVAAYVPPRLTLIHGDPLQKNIFIDPAKMEISDIIDWETSGLGNPWLDVVMAAWWMSGEYSGDEKQYISVIEGYNSVVDADLVIDVTTAKAMNPYLDILWYLNILWVRTLMGDTTQTERRKGLVQKILLELS